MNNLSPELSIVITNHNYGAYLPRLFDALRHQSRPLGNTEIILVDDGSSDDSMTIAEELGKDLDCGRFVLLQAGGKGHPAPVRNKGLARAKGALLFTIDADDLIAPEFLQACCSVLLSRPEIDLVYTAQQVVFESEEGAQPQTILLPCATPLLLSWQNVVTSPAVFRRRVWEQSQGFRSNTKYEDWDFWAQAAVKNFRFERVEQPLFTYCKHGGSFTGQAVADDAAAKAFIVQNNPGLFHVSVRKWAAHVMAGDQIEHFPRGIIPLPQDAMAILATIR
ncbi:glycosyltransferase [Desulfovibrio mangrovi]|uniref:glycosyltransferase family 2 protein n=1 Tax=Desulfovibrio mangrovi TaxID=2976983 RepID=UPI0022471791|nr:glycosyltransferase family 2 protein [Desulfovibrio mangrovi]UZP67872.1 glycosyltransferase [Desulfovibrio mangrovi]